jgi:hypothetical protein
MSSKIKVDNITDQGGNELIKRCGSTTTVGSGSGNTINVCGSTITLGRSGGTVALASGASQSGFGRAGSVDWQTGSIKTASSFTAASGEGYFVDTSSNAITANLPAGSAGAIVSFSDYARNFATNALTIAPNGSEKIGGVAADATLNVNGQAATFVYVDSTKGWVNVQNAEDTEIGEDFISASGGTESTSGNCKIHTFTSPGTFQISGLGAAANNKLAYLVVAGGGGSGGNRWHIQGGGGGGAGGFREGRDNPITPYTASPLVASALCASVASFPITVGAGGAAGGTGGGTCTPEGANATSGANSVFSTITSAGGGFGGNPRSQGPAQPEGQPGGSGGGAGGGSPSRTGGTGNTPPTSPAQGTNGGNGSQCNQTLGGSGGGATGAGSTSPGCSPPPSASSGGTGATTSITASPVVYSTGGTYSSYNPGTKDPSCAGAANTGDGGDATNAGPGGNNPASPLDNYRGKAGGSGIVVIRYKFQ